MDFPATTCLVNNFRKRQAQKWGMHDPQKYSAYFFITKSNESAIYEKNFASAIAYILPKMLASGGDKNEMEKRFSL